jgi:hypothetical protein
MVWVLLLAATGSFLLVIAWAWTGGLGVQALAVLVGSLVCFALGRRLAPQRIRGTLDTVAKVALTVGGSIALLRHPVDGGHGERVPVLTAITDHLAEVDPSTALLWCAVAAGVKLVAMFASAAGWHLLLRGQGLRFAYWQSTVTAFLIGRFVGTFMPGTLGLDGYTLYEAARYSNQGARALAAKLVEKVVGITGLFLGMVLTLPFGWSAIETGTANLGMPDRANEFALVVLAVGGGTSLAVTLVLARPGILVAASRVVVWSASFVGRSGLAGRVVGFLERFADALGGYRGQTPLLFAALFAKFVSHFLTASLYFFTALAIGVTGADFGAVVFGSTIQILGTLFSPTIAGEGARELFQAVLLSRELGGAGAAVISGALGFLAAEATAMLGGLFLWTRTPRWRPAVAEVDGQAVDFAWLEGDAGPAFSAEAVAKIRG